MIPAEISAKQDESFIKVMIIELVQSFTSSARSWWPKPYFIERLSFLRSPENQLRTNDSTVLIRFDCLHFFLLVAFCNRFSCFGMRQILTFRHLWYRYIARLFPDSLRELFLSLFAIAKASSRAPLNLLCLPDTPRRQEKQKLFPPLNAI